MNKGLSPADHPFNFNWSAVYSLPWGRGKHFGGNMPRVLDTLTGGWEIGVLGIWQSGNPFSILSGRATGPTTANTLIDYTGSGTSEA